MLVVTCLADLSNYCFSGFLEAESEPGFNGEDKQEPLRKVLLECTLYTHAVTSYAVKVQAQCPFRETLLYPECLACSEYLNRFIEAVFLGFFTLLFCVLTKNR